MGKTQAQLDPETMQKAARILKTLGHPVRITILEALENGELNVSQIQERIGESQAITSQHLRLMESRDILISRQDGVQVFYRVKDQFITKILGCIRSCGLS